MFEKQWKECTIQKHISILRAKGAATHQPGATPREMCCQYQISPVKGVTPHVAIPFKSLLPLQGKPALLTDVPGRCPGLVSFRAVGAHSGLPITWRAIQNTPISNAICRSCCLSENLASHAHCYNERYWTV